MQQADEDFGSDPQTNAEGEEKSEGKEQSRNEGSVGFGYCLKLWMLTLAKALVVATPVLIVLWMLHLPALMLRKDLLQESRNGSLAVGIILGRAAAYGFPSTYGISVFGFYISKKALFFCLLPGFIADTFIDTFVSVSFGYLIYIITVLSSIILVIRQKLPPNPSQKLIEEFKRKTEIGKPVGKMFFVISVVFYILLFIYPIFLNSRFNFKLFIRFIVLPIMTTCCTSLQLHFLKSVQNEHMDFLIPVLWITNGILKMYERIFTNSMFNSGDYVSLVATTFAAALIEIANHVTYFHRHNTIGKIAMIFNKLRNGKIRSFRTISVIPTDESQAQNEKQKHKFTDEQEWLLNLRRKLIIEEISIELMMIFTVTFILYFLHPLVENEKVETIPNFEICVVQLLIQVAFELLSDIFGIYWTITRHKVELKTSDVELTNRWFWLWIYFILFQSLYISWFLTYY